MHYKVEHAKVDGEPVVFLDVTLPDGTSVSECFSPSEFDSVCKSGIESTIARITEQEGFEPIARPKPIATKVIIGIAAALLGFLGSLAFNGGDHHTNDRDTITWCLSDESLSLNATMDRFKTVASWPPQAQKLAIKRAIVWGCADATDRKADVVDLARQILKCVGREEIERFVKADQSMSEVERTELMRRLIGALNG